MYNFLVLGLVPGTNLQITFNTWLYAIFFGITSFLLARFYRQQLDAAAWIRAPLPASQLHVRV